MEQRHEEFIAPRGPCDIITLFGVEPFQNNVYILVDPPSRECLVIDASEAAPIVTAVRGLHVRGVVLTHGHGDHHAGLATLRTHLGPDVPLSIGAPDQAMLGSPTSAIADGAEFRFGAHTLRAISTPGHTPGSTCFLLGDFLFSGDTLFPGGPGNTKQASNPLGDFDAIIESLRQRLFTLPGATRVLPGHGAATTLATELPHLDEWIARGW